MTVNNNALFPHSQTMDPSYCSCNLLSKFVRRCCNCPELAALRSFITEMDVDWDAVNEFWQDALQILDATRKSLPMSRL